MSRPPSGTLHSPLPRPIPPPPPFPHRIHANPFSPPPPPSPLPPVAALVEQLGAEEEQVAKARTMLVGKILDDLRKKADALDDDNWLYQDVPLPGK